MRHSAGRERGRGPGHITPTTLWTRTWCSMDIKIPKNQENNIISQKSKFTEKLLPHWPYSHTRHSNNLNNRVTNVIL